MEVEHDALKWLRNQQKQAGMLNRAARAANASSRE
jgi:hypothetical protein